MATVVAGLFVSAACSGSKKQDANALNGEYNEANNMEKTVDTKNGKVLIVFFSHAGENYSVGNVKVGNTKLVAEEIRKVTGSDVFEIVPEKNYNLPYRQLIDVAQEEANKGEYPSYKGKVENLDQYTTVFIGGPIWWGTFPRVMFTFFKDNDLSGKTIYPFTTHEGSGLGSVVEDLEKVYPNADVKDGFSIAGHNVRGGMNKVDNWLKSLGY